MLRERKLRERKVERERARVFTATETVATGEEAQGIEDLVSPPASKGVETKIDDAPKNAKELHAYEEYASEEIEREREAGNEAALGHGVFVLPSDDKMEEIRVKNKHVLRCKMVYARKYESVMCDDGQIRDRFLKWEGRLAAVGTGEVKSLDTSSKTQVQSWSTFSPAIGMTAMRTLIALMCRKGFDVRS
jgi:hypothetical protein